MELNEANRLKILRALPQLIKDIYGSDEIAEIITKVKYTRQLDFEVGSAVRIVGDCILGFYRTSALNGIFQSQLNIGADDAQRLTAELLELLSPITAKEEDEGNIKHEELQKLAETFAEANKKREAEVVDEPAAGLAALAEVQPEDIQPLRTMQSDMNRVHGYGAYREQNPLTEMPGETVITSSQDAALDQPTPVVPPVAPPVAPPPVSTPTTAVESDQSTTPPAPPVEPDGSVRIPISSPLKAPEDIPPTLPQQPQQ